LPQLAVRLRLLVRLKLKIVKAFFVLRKLRLQLGTLADFFEKASEAIKTDQSRLVNSFPPLCLVLMVWLSVGVTDWIHLKELLVTADKRVFFRFGIVTERFVVNLADQRLVSLNVASEALFGLVQISC